MRPRFKLHIQYHSSDATFDGVFGNIDEVTNYIRHHLSDDYNELTICIVKQFIVG